MASPDVREQLIYVNRGRKLSDENVLGRRPAEQHKRRANAGAATALIYRECGVDVQADVAECRRDGCRLRVKVGVGDEPERLAVGAQPLCGLRHEDVAEVIPHANLAAVACFDSRVDESSADGRGGNEEVRVGWRA